MSVLLCTWRRQSWPLPGPPASHGMDKEIKRPSEWASGCIIDGAKEAKTEILAQRSPSRTWVVQTT